MEAQYDVAAVRRQFPMLQREIEGKRIVYLDSAATSLKPRAVIDAIVEVYERYTANVNRGVHFLSEEVTDRFERARDVVSSFINAEPHEVVFVRNTTEAVNLVARNLPQESVVLFGSDAHHSNALPWRAHGRSEAVTMSPDGMLDLDDLHSKLRKHRPTLVAATHVSNAFGALNPIDAIIRLAHEYGAQVLVDGSQSVPHRPVDVRALDCDFLCFSAHKMCGPSGIGVLYGKHEVMEAFAPVYYGGDMVDWVHADAFALREVPSRLEAGTPNIEGAIGLAAACDFLESIGLEAIQRHEHALVCRAAERLRDVPAVRLVGPSNPALRSGAVAFTVEGIEAHGVSRLLSNRHKICVRSGFHCAQPAHELLHLAPTVRASFYLYSTDDELDRLTSALFDITANLRPRR